ncbi:MAG: flagellar biosynthetic protein FliR [Deltaproteobacteria bacterium]|nr:flagellar biosynthetic protein FliR [Deltaproteobacteria bacterium]
MEIIRFIIGNSSTFLFVLVRTGAVIMTAPIFGAVNVPMQVKAGLSFVIALILTQITAHVPLPQGLVALVLSLLGEMLIGASIGLCIRFIFTGIEFAGQVASFQMGIGMASAYDPLNSAQVTVFGKMMSIFTLLIFLSVNGHLMVLMALSRSFEVIPPYGFHLSNSLIEGMVNFSKEIFLLAIKFSAPVMAILIFVNLALGIMARTVPQLNMFVVGFAVTITVGFVVMALSLPVFETAVIGVMDRMWYGIFELIRVM